MDGKDNGTGPVSTVSSMGCKDEGALAVVVVSS